MKKRLLLTMANLLNTLKKAYQQTENCRKTGKGNRTRFGKTADIHCGFGKYRNRYRKQSCYERKRSARDFHTRVGQFSVGNIAQNR